MLNFQLQIDNKNTNFNLEKIYKIDYSSQESIIRSAQKTNSWYGYFLRLLPEIMEKKSVVNGSITKLGNGVNRLKDGLKELKARKFIHYKLKDEKPLSDKLADAHVESDDEVIEYKKLVFKQQDKILEQQTKLIEIEKNIGVVEGIIRVLLEIEGQIRSFSYMRKIELREEEKMSVNDKIAKRIQT